MQVHLRKDKNTSSEVVEKINSGEQIEVLDNSGDWWLVKTKNGKQGYVHKSRIK
ncbi:SH3 domain-containing protein [Chryseobacterium taiwanense]|uniref:SH3 domain-containing protein n=1 Tax=Chryseobacterium taiwanense TaxID=363331 RepID=UPI0009FFEB96|nr:SH3 domain-containing protein [Chryseobacterium taiwanense]